MRKFNTLKRQGLLPLVTTTVLVTTLSISIVPARAAVTVSQDFESSKTSDFSKITGKNFEGSALEISTEKVHSGYQSLKISYQSTGGYFQFTPARPVAFEVAGDTAYLSLWVYGSGRRDFGDASIRLLDKNNETFQFSVPGLAEAMGGEGWREVRATLDLTKTGAHWGDNSDGKLDRPLAYFGLAAGRSAQTPASGTVYLDDLHLSDEPIADGPIVAQAVATKPTIAVAPIVDPGGVTVPNVLTVEPVRAPTTGPGAPFLKWVFPPGQAVPFRASLNLPTPAQGQTLVWKVRDAFDTVLAQGKETVAAGGLQKVVNFSVPNPPRGVLYVTATLQNAREEVAAEAKTRAVVFTPRQRPVPIAPFVWGVAAHVGRDKGRDADDQIALMRLIGFASARSDMGWNSIQPTAGAWNWDVHDKIYAAFEREGIMPVPVLGYGTPWATTGDANSKDWHQWNNTPPRNEAFATFASEAVKRYGRLTRYWEIWNEPDIDFWLGTAPQYAALIDATVPAIKAAQPNALVMNGGFSETKRRPDFIPTYMKVVKNRPDIFAIHTHGPFDNLLRAETTVHNTLASEGWTGAKKPEVWLNEAGFSNTRGVPESEQAIQLVKKMAYSPAAGFSAYTWYDLRDDGTDPNENEHNFGLVKRDYAPKASVVAANTLLNNIGGRRFEGRLPVGNNGYALLYRGLGSTVLTAWRQSYTKGAAVVPLVVRAKAPAGTPLKLEKSDIFGNMTPVATRDGLFFLSLGNVPQYIVASGENVQFELARDNGMLLDFAPSVVATPGEALPLQIKVANPFTIPLKGTLTVEGAAPLAVDVAPSSTRPYSVAVRRQGASGSRESVRVGLESAQIPSVLEGVVEIQTAYVVPNAPAKLDVNLPQSSLVSLFKDTPMQELHFRDAADLSANVQMQNTAEGTKIRVTATDQNQFVVADPGQWWQGDSLQWAISLPGGQMWEWMAALLPNGPQMVVMMSPDGKTGASVPIDIRRQGNQTIYEWTLPRTLPGGVTLPKRFNFNFIVNDNDGQGRKGWVEWTPGIGMEKNPTAFVPLAVEQ